MLRLIKWNKKEIRYLNLKIQLIDLIKKNLNCKIKEIKSIELKLFLQKIGLN
jgi:hypothetical protein